MRVLPALVAALTLTACVPTRAPESAARLAQFECRVEALSPIAGDLYDVAGLVRDIYAGRSSLTAVVAALKPTAAELQTLMLALQACEPNGAPATAATEQVE